MPGSSAPVTQSPQVAKAHALSQPALVNRRSAPEGSKRIAPGVQVGMTCAHVPSVHMNSPPLSCHAPMMGQGTGAHASSPFASLASLDRPPESESPHERDPTKTRPPQADAVTHDTRTAIRHQGAAAPNPSLPVAPSISSFPMALVARGGGIPSPLPVRTVDPSAGSAPP